MGQILTPDNLPDLAIASTTTITMGTSYLGRPTRLTIGGQQYQYGSVITINFATVGMNGLDAGAIASNTLYYLYAVVAAGVPGLVASLNAPTAGPTGFVAWKEVGRCRTLFTAATLAAVANRDSGVARNSADRDWQTYTPIIKTESNVLITLNTAVTYAPPGGKWKRDVSTMDLQISMRNGNGGAASAGAGVYFLMGLPSGYNVSTPNLPDPAAGFRVSGFGQADNLNRNGGVYSIGIIGGVPCITFINGATGDHLLVTAVGASNSVSLIASIPIAEWVGLYT